MTDGYIIPFKINQNTDLDSDGLNELLSRCWFACPKCGNDLSIRLMQRNKDPTFYCSNCDKEFEAKFQEVK